MVKQLVFELFGMNCKGVLLSLKGNSCEFVTRPLPSARPPHENRDTRSLRLGLKSKQAFVNELTIRAEPGTLLCFPLVNTSQFWLWLPSQVPTWMGVRFSRKSPESWSTKRHFPDAVYQIYQHILRVGFHKLTLIGVLVMALVAVLSFG